MKINNILISKMMGPLIAVLVLSSAQSCSLKRDARVTIVYGKITDQNGLPIDSMAVIMLGHISLSSGHVPIGQANTNAKGKYELMVDVPKRYSKVSAIIHSDYPSILGKYLERKVFKDGIQQNDCCVLKLGGKTNYDFVMLPR